LRGWEFAAANEQLLVSKDVQFHDRGVVQGAPTNLIWLRIGNCPTSTVESLLSRNFLQVHRFVADATKTVFVVA
jgi:predicted nuclease of predicted toxin-antitoxin system